MVYSPNEMCDKTLSRYTPNNSPWGVTFAVCMRRTIRRMLLRLKNQFTTPNCVNSFVLCLEPFLDIYQLCIKINLKVKMRRQKWHFMTLLDTNVQFTRIRLWSLLRNPTFDLYALITSSDHYPRITYLDQSDHLSYLNTFIVRCAT